MEPAQDHTVSGLKFSHSVDWKRRIDRCGEVEVPLANEYLQFLAVVIDETTWDFPETINTSCPVDECDGQEISTFLNGPKQLVWGCTVCGENGAIENWQDGEHSTSFASRILRTLMEIVRGRKH